MFVVLWARCSRTKDGCLPCFMEDDVARSGHQAMVNGLTLLVAHRQY